MKNVLIYVACMVAIFIGFYLLFCDDLFLCAGGLLWLGMVYVSGVVFPRVWRRFFALNVLFMAHIVRRAHARSNN